MIDGNPIWMFRIQRDVLVDDFNIFSKYTPEKPDVHAAQSTAINPISLFLFELSASVDFAPELCTIATPIVNTN